MEIQIGNRKNIILEKKGKDFIIDGEKANLELAHVNERLFKVFKNNKIYTAELLEKKENELIISIDGKTVTVSILDPMDKILESMGMSSVASSSVKEIKAPMPGTILSVSVREGDLVQKGDPLLILEAMKMENIIKSPGEGSVQKVLIKEGENVEKNQILISFN
ncbi:MAG: biotin/lipoyl-containing protein [Cyclobacteriaceae bacterium]